MVTKRRDLFKTLDQVLKSVNLSSFGLVLVCKGLLVCHVHIVALFKSIDKLSLHLLYTVQPVK